MLFRSETEAKEIQDLYLEGRKAEAAAAVPHDLLTGITLIGDEDALRTKLRAFWDAGVRTLLINPMAPGAEQKVEHVRVLAGLAAELRAELGR